MFKPGTHVRVRSDGDLSDFAFVKCVVLSLEEAKQREPGRWDIIGSSPGYTIVLCSRPVWGYVTWQIPSKLLEQGDGLLDV